MESKQDYLAKLQVAVEHLHDCGATWCKTVPVHEKFQEHTVWQGDVEVFDLHGHDKAKRCYAWAHLDGPNDELTRVVAVLEISPVRDAITAVRAQIVKDVKEAKK
jgi:hypothetical protein